MQLDPETLLKYARELTYAELEKDAANIVNTVAGMAGKTMRMASPGAAKAAPAAAAATPASSAARAAAKRARPAAPAPLKADVQNAALDTKVLDVQTAPTGTARQTALAGEVKGKLSTPWYNRSSGFSAGGHTVTKGHLAAGGTAVGVGALGAGYAMSGNGQQKAASLVEELYEERLTKLAADDEGHPYLGTAVGGAVAGAMGAGGGHALGVHSMRGATEKYQRVAQQFADRAMAGAHAHLNADMDHLVAGGSLETAPGTRAARNTAARGNRLLEIAHNIETKTRARGIGGAVVGGLAAGLGGAVLGHYIGSPAQQKTAAIADLYEARLAELEKEAGMSASGQRIFNAVKGYVQGGKAAAPAATAAAKDPFFKRQIGQTGFNYGHVAGAGAATLGLGGAGYAAGRMMQPAAQQNPNDQYQPIR